jgi:hypothetical protein
LFDLPLITDTDYANGYYAAVTGTSVEAWPGAAIFKSSDGGVNYSSIVEATNPSSFGRTTTALGDFTGGNIFDETNSVTVVLVAGSPALVSSNELGVLNGANVCVIDSEVLQFKTATLMGTYTYLLSGLLRGRRGTEWATGTHAANGTFALLPAINIEGAFAELNQARIYRGVTMGEALSSASDVTFTNTGRALKPYAPAHLEGGRSAALDIAVTWQRRVRLNGAWSDGADVPLDYGVESYIVTVYTSGSYATVKRTITSSSQSAGYSAAEQTTDFGSTQATVYVGVQQLGASSSTTNLDQILANQSQKEVTANALFDATSRATGFGRRASGCTGLTWAYYGATVDVAGTPTIIANGTITLTASTTNYLYATSSGTVTKTTSTPSGWPGPLASSAVALYSIVTGTNTVTSYTDYRLASGATGPTGANWSLTVNAQTGTTYTLVAGDNGKVVTLSNGSAITLTVPSGLGANFACEVIQIGAGQVTVAASGVTLNSFGGLVAFAGQHAAASLVAYVADVFNLSGNLV